MSPKVMEGQDPVFFNFAHVFKWIKYLESLDIRIFYIRRYFAKMFQSLISLPISYRASKFQKKRPMPHNVMEG